MKNIIDDIKKNEYKNVYLLYGEETYLKLQYRDKLKNALMLEEDAMNYSHYEGKGISEGEVIDLAETMPFFSEHRVIVLEDTGFFKNASEKLPEYMKSLPDYLVMIFVESEVDKRNKMFKAVQKAGRVVEFSTQKEDTLLTWVARLLANVDKRITKADAQYLLSRTGTDMNNIAAEVEKLICYTLDRDIVTREDIDAICTEQTENRIFEMIRAVTEQNQEKALELYYDLLALKEPPMRILFLLARQYNQLLQVKELMEHGNGQQEIAGKMKLQSFIVRNYINYAKRYTKKELIQMVSACMETEEAVKTGLLTDVLSVELLIVDFSSKN